MSIESVPGTPLSYYLISFDKNGIERTDDPDGGTFSRRVLADLQSQPITDVFLLSHGWKGDVEAARDQYNHWIAAMVACPDDIARMRALRQDFRPMLIGLHWPSLPFGNEEFGGGAASFDPGAMPDARCARQRVRRPHRGYDGGARRPADDLRGRGGRRRSLPRFRRPSPTRIGR